MIRTATALVILAIALNPAAASARNRPATLAPPGQSAVSQYLETVPTDAGSAPPGGHAQGGGTPGAGGPGTGGGGRAPGLSAAQQQQLDHLGSRGRLLAKVVAATAATGRSATAVSVHRLDPGSTSPVSSILSAATGHGSGGGSGLLLPLLLGGGVLVVLAGTLRRLGIRQS